MTLLMALILVMLGVVAGVGIAVAYYNRATVDAKQLRWSRKAYILLRDLTYTPDALDLRGRATQAIADYEQLSAINRKDT